MYAFSRYYAAESDASVEPVIPTQPDSHRNGRESSARVNHYAHGTINVHMHRGEDDDNNIVGMGSGRPVFVFLSDNRNDWLVALITAHE